MALTKTILKVLGLSSAAPPAGYAEVKEARATILVGGESAQVPLVHLVDDLGESLSPLTDAQLRASALPVALDVGTAGTDIAPPAGAAGLAGWLSGVYKKLGEALNIRALSGATDSVSVSNFPATQAVIAEALPLPAGASTSALQTAGNSALSEIMAKLIAAPATEAKQDTSITALAAIHAKLGAILAVNPVTKEATTYLAGIAVIPTGLTTGLNYFWIRNTDPTKKIKIHKIEIIMTFTGTAAATRSIYALKKFTGATATVGTVTLGATPAQTGAPASIADIKWAAAGGTLTGATVTPVGTNLIQIGHANQLTANLVYDRNLSDAPLVLSQNEGLVLQSDGAVVLGTTVIIGLRWSEE